MKKLILISALLLVASNGWADDLPTDGTFQINHPNGKLYLKGELMNDKNIETPTGKATWPVSSVQSILKLLEK